MKTIQENTDKLAVIETLYRTPTLDRGMVNLNAHIFDISSTSL